MKTYKDLYDYVVECYENACNNGYDLSNEPYDSVAFEMYNCVDFVDYEKEGYTIVDIEEAIFSYRGY